MKKPEQPTLTVKKMGFNNVSHIEGGFTAWENIGGPIEKLN